MSGSAVRDGIIPCPPARGDLPSVSWTEENMQLHSGKQSKQTGVFCVEAGRGEASSSAHCLVESGCHWEKHDENKSRQLALAQWSGRLDGAGSPPCLARMS